MFQKLVFHAIKIPVDRWHSCLGHPSRDIVHHVISKNNFHVQPLIVHVLVCVMLVLVPKHINYHISCPPVLLLLLYNLYFLMSGVMLLNLLV
jgi:hypothetical protein